MNGWIAFAAVVFLACVAGIGYQQGKSAGKLECESARAVNVEKTQKAIDQRDTRSAANNASMIDWLAANVPPIQAKADESAAKIVTVYRDRVVRVGDDQCSRPASVQAELDAARIRANGAGTALQAKPAAHGPARTAPAIGG